MKKNNIMQMLLREAGIGVALVILCIFFAFTAPNFATYDNITKIFTQISINIVIAVGMTFVILLGGIDLSVGAVLALASIIAGKIIANSVLPVWLSIILAIIASIGVGTVCGLFNGYVSERWKIPSFIVTLGMMNIARGFALQISDSRTIFNFPTAFNQFGSLTILGIPIIFILATIIVIVGSFILKHTVFGRLIYAIGNNEEAVRLSGHNPAVFKIIVFTLCGAAVGITAILYMLRLNIASPILGVGFELSAIAAVVIGGTSMSGGKGSLMGTFLGAGIMGVLNNGLLLVGMGDFARQIVTGMIIIAAVILDDYRVKFSDKLSNQTEQKKITFKQWLSQKGRKKQLVMIFSIAVIIIGGIVIPRSIGAYSDKLSADNKIVLSWIHQSRFAGEYIAKEKGFYKEKDINISFQETSPAEDPVEILLTEDFDFMICQPEDLLVAISKGAEVKAVAVTMRDTPIHFYSWPKHNIESLEDFIGMNVSVNSKELMILKHLLASRNIQETDITLSERDSYLYDIFYDKVEIQGASAIIDYLSALEKGMRLTYLEPSEYGLHYYTDIIVTTNKLIEEEPDYVQAFIDATLEGWRYAAENQKEAARISQNYSESIATADKNEMILSEIIPLLNEENIGNMSLQEWQIIYDILLKEQLIEENIEVDTIFTTQFLH